MPADNGAVRTEHVFRLRETYSISERIRLLRRYRFFFDRLGAAEGKRLSSQAVADVVDDAFNDFSCWLEISDGYFKSVYKGRLDTHTMRNLLRCELGLGVRKIHVRSFRVLDAFLQIAEHDPPEWLEELLAKNSAKISPPFADAKRE